MPEPHRSGDSHILIDGTTLHDKMPDQSHAVLARCRGCGFSAVHYPCTVRTSSFGRREFVPETKRTHRSCEMNVLSREASLTGLEARVRMGCHDVLALEVGTAIASGLSLSSPGSIKIGTASGVCPVGGHLHSPTHSHASSSDAGT